ncbi:MAG: hypothetical protein H7242_12535 [Microbacteriaceae bacterium]|nr:hypothetical protein [Burkholderiaceae bacterium]
MKKPWVLALVAGLIVLLLAMALPLWRMAGGGGETQAGTAAAKGLPWQVTLLQAADAGRAEVFGLVPGRDTLADAEALLPDRLQVALVARVGEVGVLEALVEPYVAGFVAGRLVLAFEADAAARARWREQASGSQPMEGGVRRFTLRASDHDQARRARLVGLSFLPTVRLSEADVRQRFGAPAEVLVQPAGSQALLYPGLGLVASVATVANSQRGVLQYVAPMVFARRAQTLLLTAAPLVKP